MVNSGAELHPRPRLKPVSPYLATGHQNPPRTFWKRQIPSPCPRLCRAPSLGQGLCAWRCPGCSVGESRAWGQAASSLHEGPSVGVGWAASAPRGPAGLCPMGSAWIPAMDVYPTLCVEGSSFDLCEVLSRSSAISVCLLLGERLAGDWSQVFTPCWFLCLRVHCHSSAGMGFSPCQGDLWQGLRSAPGQCRAPEICTGAE